MFAVNYLGPLGPRLIGVRETEDQAELLAAQKTMEILGIQVQSNPTEENINRVALFYSQNFTIERLG